MKSSGKGRSHAGVERNVTKIGRIFFKQRLVLENETSVATMERAAVQTHASIRVVSSLWVFVYADPKSVCSCTTSYFRNTYDHSNARLKITLNSLYTTHISLRRPYCAYRNVIVNRNLAHIFLWNLWSVEYIFHKIKQP